MNTRSARFHAKRYRVNAIARPNRKTKFILRAIDNLTGTSHRRRAMPRRQTGGKARSASRIGHRCRERKFFGFK